MLEKPTVFYIILYMYVVLRLLDTSRRATQRRVPTDEKLLLEMTIPWIAIRKLDHTVRRDMTPRAQRVTWNWS